MKRTAIIIVATCLLAGCNDNTLMWQVQIDGPVEHMSGLSKQDCDVAAQRMQSPHSVPKQIVAFAWCVGP
jgi:PBP1b-binding outer membrane lipoprotein LpoB